MCKKDLIKKLAESVDFTYKKAEAAVNGLLEAISESVAKGDDVKIIGFGSFVKRARKERVGRNPKTGESMKIPATNAVVFKSSPMLRKVVNEVSNG